jgi:heat shock protein HslJ
MQSLRRCAAGVLAALALAGSMLPAAADDSAFPFGRELALDVEPLPGTKRVPIIEIDENGAAAFHLWCATLSGSAKVADDSITIVPTKPLSVQCTPERLSQDAALLAALSQMTSWRRQGDVVEFLGATNLRFKLLTN